MTVGKHLPLKLGKKPARPGAIKFRLLDYYDLSALPHVPAVYGHGSAVQVPWKMLGNDQWGDCVLAGAAHETMLFTRLGVAPDVDFNDHGVLEDYSAVTGFNPNDPDTDQGTDMQAAASYRRKIGVVDSQGNRHKVEAYLGVDPDKVTTLAAASYVFTAIGIGIEFPASAMDQFNKNKPWSVVSKSPIEGGHYIPLIGRNKAGHYLVVTWGRIQEVTKGFLDKYTDEAVVYITREVMSDAGKTPEGFDIEALQRNLAALPRAV